MTLRCYWLPPVQLPATWRTDVTCSACAAPIPDIDPDAPVIEPVLDEPVLPAIEPVDPVVEPVDPVVEPVAPVVDEPAPAAVDPVPAVEPVLDPAPDIAPVDPLPVPYAPGDAAPAASSVPRISTREFT
jgi:hypothetical protein